ncbi:MAG: type 2 isopentenyl-diphosphate Delta-isomerase [Blastocatellia bacterium]|nr:type 2 isopentenyl-diphosphate Delta-isomerase [Blastocatellia bacterium]
MSESQASEIINRKQSHFDLCAQQNVEFKTKTTWLEHVELVHQPLTETLLDELDLSVEICGKRLRAPLVITAMTGGTPDTGKFNKEVAALADRLGLGFGVGSQRVMLNHPEVTDTFRVREQAPNVLLLGNIGIAQARELSTAQLQKLANDIEADALCVHLNTAMEIVQQHGDRDFRGSLKAIERLIHELPVPIIVKETGCGFARETGEKLAAAGVQWIDVSGAGGTSWVGVETLRNRALQHLGEAFWDWGVPTAASVLELRGLGINLIASGGIRTGMHAAKTIALGAQAAGVALPVLRAYVNSGIDAVEEYLLAMMTELRAAIMLCGCERVADMQANRAVLSGQLLEWAAQRNLQSINDAL